MVVISSRAEYHITSPSSHVYWHQDFPSFGLQIWTSCLLVHVRVYHGCIYCFRLSNTSKMRLPKTMFMSLPDFSPPSDSRQSKFLQSFQTKNQNFKLHRSSPRTFDTAFCIDVCVSVTRTVPFGPRAGKDRKKPDRVVFDCQERAYWVVHRPPVSVFFSFSNQCFS